MSLLILAKGFTLTLSMIMPIGTQNSMLINQGISRNHHKMTAALFVLYDVLLISLGVLGGSILLSQSPTLFNLLTWGGILFLSVYGLLSMKSAFAKNNNSADSVLKKKSAKIVFLTTLAVTFLNPHAYIDTVMVIGSVGGQYAGEAKIYFLIGSILGSMAWFGCLALGAAKLSKQLSRPRVKMTIDIIIALVMWLVAWSLFNTWMAR
ncbi:LysE/ArgO family amino acid transporter [Colwellia piezophila]|uniref:LysE/ArgO family amino acid transporter n=1 Tax=Colwellia piezophila TaxID=211668 RepID=UPI000364C13C|nr:LysE/ArgO family amino acid transporter [Colwellia piezophila]